MKTPLRSIACLTAMTLLATTHAHAEEAQAGSKVITEGVEPGAFTQDYDAAMAYAKEHKVPIFVNFTGSDWCGWCKLMEKSVFSKPEWSAYAKANLVQIWLDYPRDKSKVPEAYRERNDELRAQFGVRGYPTYIVMDWDGRRLGRLGAGREKTAESFQKEVALLLRNTTASVAKRCETFNDADATVVMAQMNLLSAAQANLAEVKTEAAALRKQAQALEEAATTQVQKSQEAFDAAMETGKVNVMTPEQKADFETAKQAMADAEKAIEAWQDANSGKKQTPEMRETRTALMTALTEAKDRVDSF